MNAWTYSSKLARDAWDLLNIMLWLVAALLMSVTYALNLIGLAVAGGWLRFIGAVIPPIGAVIGFMDLMAAITGYGV